MKLGEEVWAIVDAEGEMKEYRDSEQQAVWRLEYRLKIWPVHYETARVVRCKLVEICEVNDA